MIPSKSQSSLVDPKDPATGKPSTPQTLVLNLFDDVVLTGIVDASDKPVEPTSSGYALWGSLDGVELGTMTLVVNGKIVVGTVRTLEAVYSIRTAGDGKYVIRQIDESLLPPPGEPLRGPLSAPPVPTQADDNPPDDGSVIDVMVVYTPLVRRREGGRAAAEALIDLFVAETNQANVNSGVTHRIRLVLKEEVEYTDTGTFVDIGRLADDFDGYMDHVHELRDLYAADLVHLIVSKAIDFCGVARMGGSFGVTANICGGLTFAHELGHNMGLDHDRYVVGRLKDIPQGIPVTGSHYGYVNQRMFDEGAPESAYWRTIMAYSWQCGEADLWCPRIGYFSNPENSYNGDPMGVPADNPSTGVDGPADAVGTLNLRRGITANYRQSSTSPTPRMALAMSQYWLPENGGVATVRATLHRPSNNDTIVTVSASPADAVTMSGNQTLTIPAGETLSIDAVTITGIDNGDRTGDVIVEISATATNTSDLGVMAPEPVELAIADDETTPVVTLSLSPMEIVEGGEWPDDWTNITASLDNRSAADTTVTVSAAPVDAIEEIYSDTLTIPAGQMTSSGYGVRIYARNDEELAESEKTVTVSGAATNPHGVTGPESVTLTIIDDDAPFFAADSIAYTFTAGVAASRVLPEADYGNGTLTYSLSPAPSNGVTFASGPPARIGVSETSIAAGETSYTLTATDAQGDTDTMTVSITVIEGVCANSAAVAGYSDPGIVTNCEALLSSMDALRGDQPLNWSEYLSIGDWQGIEIVDSRIVGIDLSSLGLSGSIPPELGSLTNLQSLQLFGNKLTGPIPAALGGLSNLRKLDLGGNELTGEIPVELGGLTNLIRLDIGFNQMTGRIPTELGELNNLRGLSLGENQLTGAIPAELGDLSNLEELSLYQNEFTGPIPAELGGLSNLRSLGLNWNQLTGPIPVQLGGLINLRELSIGANQLTGGIPSQLGNLSNLGELWLGENELTGPIPTELGNLVNLRSLSLGQNRLTGEIPSELGDLSNLRDLYLRHNKLTGPIPSELGNLSNLESLYLSGNLLTGCVPDGLRDVPNNDFAGLGLPFCTELACSTLAAASDESNNPGLVSDCVALLAAREVLVETATLNWSTDTPIADWSGVVLGGTPRRVTELQLSGLSLDGEIPTELGSLANLRSLDLSDNQLTGPIPTELGDLVNLQELYLRGNKLFGCIPDKLSDVPNNDISGLGLSLCSEHPCVSGGAVPDATNAGLVSDCEMLLAFRDTLAGTATLDWAGDTPVADWSGVGVGGFPERVLVLSLSGRGLTGELPKELGSLDKLESLELQINALTGEIPAELGSLANLTRLILHTNELTGKIPGEIGGLSNLRLLRLDENMLTGAIPEELGNLSHLTDMELWGNRLSGEIPTGLGRLSNLTVLALNDNDLEGSIPASLGSLTNLERIWLSNNPFTGCVPPRLRDVSHNDLDQVGLPFCPLSAPEAVTVSYVTSEFDALTISWAPPLSDGGSAITVYDLRYIETSADEEDDSNWTLEDDVWTTGSGALEYTLTGLTGGVQYDIQVRAVNAEGDGPWSETATGTPTASDCVREGAVADATNAGLISDCEALLAVARHPGWKRDSLNWATDTSISQWDGIGLGGTPRRVSRLNLSNAGLSGTIPASLGRLSELTHLNLRSNPDLTGEIPDALGNLSNLRVLNLHSNSHSGAIPNLSGATKLEELYLPNNADYNADRSKVRDSGLTGTIPKWLNGMTNMRELWLWGNSLTDTVPDLSGMTSLQKLKLANNDLTGGVPEASMLPPNMTWLIIDRNRLGGEIPDLSSLSKLRLLWLHSNELTGSIPSGDHFPASLDDLNLRDNKLTGTIPDLATWTT